MQPTRPVLHDPFLNRLQCLCVCVQHTEDAAMEAHAEHTQAGRDRLDQLGRVRAHLAGLYTFTET